METKPIYNEDLHFEHEQWKRELAFWEDEIQTFKNRLDELLKKSECKEDLTSLDHFENRFRIHLDKIHEFKERIYAHELNISKHYEAGENAIDRRAFEYHLDFREQMETQRKMYQELKKEFFGYITAKMRER